ncbi:MAG: DUF3822 family protein [Bacteroidetes bacterium]|nr:DUF3822 family protein [Bacteroidota bacterium]
MAIPGALAYQHALCMDLRHDKFVAAALHKSTKKIADQKVFPVTEFNRAGLDKILSDDFFKPEFADFVLTAGAIRNTLIPTGIFNVSKPAEIFKLNYTEPVDNLDYNRIPELDIVNIYELPLWVKSAFVIKFPRVKILHRSSVLLKGIFDQPTFSPKAHLFIEESSFYLFMTEKNKLQYFNRFDYKSLADIVYHVLFVAEQKGIQQENLNLQLYGIPATWGPLNEFRSFFKNTPNLSDEIEKGEYFMLAKQLLCV